MGIIEILRAGRLDDLVSHVQGVLDTFRDLNQRRQIYTETFAVLAVEQRKRFRDIGPLLGVVIHVLRIWLQQAFFRNARSMNLVVCVGVSKKVLLIQTPDRTGPSVYRHLRLVTLRGGVVSRRSIQGDRNAHDRVDLHLAALTAADLSFQRTLQEEFERFHARCG